MIANIKQKQFRKKDEEYIIGQIEKNQEKNEYSIGANSV